MGNPISESTSAKKETPVRDLKPKPDLNTAEDKHKEEENKVLAMLKDKYGLGEEELEACKQTEAGLSNKENKITSLEDALGYYLDKDLSTSQLVFMAINSHSRGNAFANENMELRHALSQMQMQVNALLQAGKVQMEGQKPKE